MLAYTSTSLLVWLIRLLGLLRVEDGIDSEESSILLRLD